MTVRGEKAATGSAAKRLHVESGRFLYDDRHSTRSQAVFGRTQDDRRVGDYPAAGAHAASRMRQEGCVSFRADTGAVRRAAVVSCEIREGILQSWVCMREGPG